MPLSYGSIAGWQRFDTMPSNPMRHACLNNVGPSSPSMCALSAIRGFSARVPPHGGTGSAGPQGHISDGNRPAQNPNRRLPVKTIILALAAVAALATSAQAGGYGYSYGHSYGYNSYGYNSYGYNSYSYNYYRPTYRTYYYTPSYSYGYSYGY